MAWLPISWTVPQYMDSNGDPYSGAVLKFYQDGTTTVTNMATSNTGGTQLTSVALNANGYPANGGSVFIPHIDQAYKVSLYPTQAAANANTGAIWTIDNLTPADLTDTDTDELTKVSSNDTTAGYLNGKLTGGTGITLTENSDGANETLDVALTGDGYLISESNDHNNAPVAGVGEIWVKNDTPNRLYYTDDEENDFALSSPAPIANHIQMGKIYLFDGTTNTNYPLFALTTDVTKATWETCGKTGATNPWTAIDQLPTSARAVIVAINGAFIANAGASMSCYFASADVASPPTSHHTQAYRFMQQVTGTTSPTPTTFAVIPMNASQQFKAYWTDTGSVTSTFIELDYRGYITD